jgi:hypothetical protein
LTQIHRVQPRLRHSTNDQKETIRIRDAPSRIRGTVEHHATDDNGEDKVEVVYDYEVEGRKVGFKGHYGVRVVEAGGETRNGTRSDRFGGIEAWKNSHWKVLVILRNLEERLSSKVYVLEVKKVRARHIEVLLLMWGKRIFLRYEKALAG